MSSECSGRNLWEVLELTSRSCYKMAAWRGCAGVKVAAHIRTNDFDYFKNICHVCHMYYLTGQLPCQ